MFRPTTVTRLFSATFALLVSSVMLAYAIIPASPGIA